nr:ribonuclease H-like domain-containing protein [Tanacetum cinerariifolium]
MKSLSPQVVSVVKLPILNPNEFDLWKMRIEQFFLITDYSLWEVIINGYSSIPTRVIEGVVQPVAHTTAEQRLARKNELKARGTLLMALSYKHQLKFNIHKDAKTLMEAIKKSTNEPVSAVASVSAASAKILISALSNVDTLSNAIIYSFFASQSNSPQLDNDDLKQIDRTGRNLGENYHRKGHFTRECSVMVWAAMTGAFRQKKNQPTIPSSHSPPQVLPVLTMSSETDESLPASPIYDRYQSEEGYHVVPPPYTGTFKPPKPDLVFHDAPDVNETVHTAFNVKFSPTKPDKDLSHTHRPSAPIIEDWVSDSKDDSEAELPHNALSFVHSTKQVKTPRPFVKTVENSILAANHKTTIPKPKTHGNSRNRKACFVCKSLTHLIKDYDYYKKKIAQTPARNHAQRGNHQHYARMTLPNPQRHVVPTTVLTKSKLVPLTTARPVTTADPQPHVTRSRPAKTVVTKPHSPPRRNINRRPFPKPSNFPPKFTTVKAPMGNPQHALKDKGVIDSGCSRHMIGNMSYFSDFEKINGGYVAFGGNPKGGKITRKGKIRTGKLDFDDVYFVKELKFNLFSVSQMCDKKNIVLFTNTECIVLSPEFKLPDENQVLLRVPRENNMYNVDLNNIVSSGDLTCLFANATLDESNLWHRRLGHINFKTMNKLVKGNLVRGLLK